ncbi:coiled-coil domain-containing protein 84-like isoform X2 [Octopus sinensis]|uniref:Coiled-coil domain-containing protein 84-like isoform X2 n=1 Tax=Octopus sinensis TaxID=2607531 RepID=A0A7E6FFW1_9MOLL|nr:coiled-coil domain-containing protein 84-like isoform X2 [Octopus sinensis]
MSSDPQQFQFCSICHASHTGGKKHVYSKKHKLFLDKALQRFDEKLSLCRKAIENPSVINLCNEKMNLQNVWCYFCSVEIERHSVNGNFLIMEHNLLAHLTTELHKTNTRLFFQKNFLKNYNKYIFTEKEFERHNESVLKATKDLEKQFQTEIFVKMQDIHKAELHKSSVASHVPEAKNITRQSLKPDVTSHTLPQFKKTIAAFGDGLTLIKMKNVNIPNVHSGGLPPWMQVSDNSTEHQVIGPSIVDYQKHLTDVRMSKLPKERVGANLSKEISVNAQWLPSFGCVWNNRRRLDTKHQFLKKKANMFGKRPMKTGKSATAVASTGAPQSRVSGKKDVHPAVVSVKPYKKKRCVT